jgi:hypothetical protein
MRYHIQELRRNRAIEDKVAIEELHFLNSLVSLQASCRCGCRGGSGFGVVLILLPTVRIWAVWILRLEDRAIIILVFKVRWVIIGREVCQRVFFVR